MFRENIDNKGNHIKRFKIFSCIPFSIFEIVFNIFDLSLLLEQSPYTVILSLFSRDSIFELDFFLKTRFKLKNFIF